MQACRKDTFFVPHRHLLRPFIVLRAVAPVTGRLLLLPFLRTLPLDASLRRGRLLLVLTVVAPPLEHLLRLLALGPEEDLPQPRNGRLLVLDQVTEVDEGLYESLQKLVVLLVHRRLHTYQQRIEILRLQIDSPGGLSRHSTSRGSRENAG